MFSRFDWTPTCDGRIDGHMAVASSTLSTLCVNNITKKELEAKIVERRIKMRSVKGASRIHNKQAR